MLRKISMSLCCMVILLMFSSSVGASVKLFEDVYSDDWYARDVYALVDHGLVSGYPDNTFRGGENITRAEFITILMNSDMTLSVLSSNSYVYLSDISNHWAEDNILSATEKGFVSGYDDGTFQPNQPITREEAFTIIHRIVKQCNINYTENNVNSFIDENDCSEWALESIKYLHRVGIVNGYNDNSVKPKDEITRGETASLFRQLMGYEKYSGDIGTATRPIPQPEPTYSLLGTYKITFYCPNGCCGSPNGITASGNKGTPYKTVAMKGIPFGTVVKIEFSRSDLQYLNGEYVVEDRGVGYGVVDLMLPYHSLCYQLGVDKNAKVYILDK